MRIIYVHQKVFQHRPPVISTTMLISELGEKVEVITTGISAHFKTLLKEKGVDHMVFPFDYSSSTIKNSLTSLSWGRKVRNYIRKRSKEEHVVLWIEGNHTITSLGYRFINQYHHVLQLQELFGIHLLKDRIQYYYMRKVSQTAIAIMCPEYNRSFIFYAYFKLRRPPYVMPNKQVFMTSNDLIKGFENKYTWLKDKIGNRKVILYQGLITPERQLDHFIEALGKLDSTRYVIVLMGKASAVLDNYFKICPNLIHVDYIPAPEYLYITSLASIGILCYTSYELNTVYCAPNKIFEYGMNGIPMIGNDIPGLRYMLEYYRMGKVCDLDSEESIVTAFESIMDNYDEFSSNARSYYETIDNKLIVERVIKDIKNDVAIKE